MKPLPLLQRRHLALSYPDAPPPAVLVSYVYLKPFLQARPRLYFRDWIMDSGAYSAYNSGKVIKLQDYIDTCKRLQESDPTLVEIYALDDILDWKTSLKNTEEMWKQGVKAIPCYHIGEPESLLLSLSRDYPKVALGGVASKAARRKFEWASQCFARIWPCKIHGFGFSSDRHLMDLPWHSTDSTSWEMGPGCFGNWRSFGKMKVTGSYQDLRAEVKYFLDLETRTRDRWRTTMKEIGCNDGQSPTIRLGLL